MRNRGIVSEKGKSGRRRSRFGGVESWTAPGAANITANLISAGTTFFNATVSQPATAFAADTWSGLTSGTTIAGRTASDGSSVWTAHGTTFLGNGSGGVYPQSGNFVGEIISIDNNVASQANQDITWTWVPQADPKLTGGNGWSTAVVAKIRNATFSQAVYAVFDTASGSGGEIYLYENDAYGSFQRASTHSSNISSLTVTIDCTLSIRAGVATLTCTGGVTFSTTLTLSITASALGGIGLASYSPSGGVDLTHGVHTGPISASNYTGAATSYSFIAGRDISFGGTISYASKFPSAFAINNQNVGNADAGFAGNRLMSLILNGVAPGGGFTFTPTGFTVQDNAGSSHSTIAIAAGADAYEFAPLPAAGTVADLAITGTNNAGLSNPSIIANVRPKVCFLEGDSISSKAFGAVYLDAVRTAIGSTWLLQPTAGEHSKLDDGTGSTTYNIKLRSPITVEPFHDATRTLEGAILWAGTNDIYAGTSAATAYASLQTIITGWKTAGFSNIAIVTMLPRDGSGASGGQSAMETRRQSFNTLIKAGYGASGTDTSVTVLDIGGDATLGGASAWSNTTYYPSGFEPTTSASTTIISGTYISPWINGLTAGAQTIVPNAPSAATQFYGATIGRGSVNIATNAPSASTTFYSAVVGGQAIATNAPSASTQFYGATVTPGAVNIATNAPSAATQFYNATVSQPATAFAADTWSGLTSGTSIVGRTASDGSSVWTAHSGDFKGNGSGGVYPTTGKFSGQLISIDNNVASQANQDITWTWVPTATPLLTGGNGWATMVAAKIRNAQFTQCVYAILDTASGSGGEIYMVENDAYGGFARASSHSSYFTSLGSTIDCTLSIRAGVATLTCTGGVTFSTTLTLSIVAGSFGGIGLMAYSPSGGVDATHGVHTGPISASNYTTAATSYSLIPARDIYTGSTVSYASKFPSAFAIANPNVGNVDAGFAGNRLLSLVLNGVAPGGGFTFTPTGFTIRDSAGSSHSTISIAAGADAYEFALVPAAGQITDLTVAGTNNAGYSNPSITANVRPKICFMEGDSISSTGFGAVWPPATQTAIGSTWLFQTTAREYSQLDDGTASPTTNVKLRSAITVEPFRDATRTLEAAILWAGTNDIYAGTSAATAYASLQSIITAWKTAGFTNIAICTMLPRDGSGASGGQAAMEARRQSFNTLIKAGYGSSGTDTSVTVLDIGGDATMGGASAWSNTTYYPDGVHPQSSASTTIISGTYISPWINGLTAGAQTIVGNAPSAATQFYGATLTSGTANITTNAPSASTQFYAATVGNQGTIGASLVASSAQFFGPTVAPGAVNVGASLIAASATIFPPVLSVGSLVQALAIASGGTFGSSVITVGPVTILGAAPTSSAHFLNALVSGGEVFLSIDAAWSVKDGERLHWRARR